MIVDFGQHKMGVNAVRATMWQGRSGAVHTLAAQALDSFALDRSTLHIIIGGPLVLWVGSATDIVEDHESRTRFRLALDCADRVFAIAAPSDPAERATLIWDLEGGQPRNGTLNAA